MLRSSLQSRQLLHQLKESKFSRFLKEFEKKTKLQENASYYNKKLRLIFIREKKIFDCQGHC